MYPVGDGRRGPSRTVPRPTESSIRHESLRLGHYPPRSGRRAPGRQGPPGTNPICHRPLAIVGRPASNLAWDRTSDGDSSWLLGEAQVRPGLSQRLRRTIDREPRCDGQMLVLVSFAPSLTHCVSESRARRSSLVAVPPHAGRGPGGVARPGVASLPQAASFLAEVSPSARSPTSPGARHAEAAKVARLRDWARPPLLGGTHFSYAQAY